MLLKRGKTPTRQLSSPYHDLKKKKRKSSGENRRNCEEKIKEMEGNLTSAPLLPCAALSCTLLLHFLRLPSSSLLESKSSRIFSHRLQVKSPSQPLHLSYCLLESSSSSTAAASLLSSSLSLRPPSFRISIFFNCHCKSSLQQPLFSAAAAASSTAAAAVFFADCSISLCL